jgi:hypothetical protein
VPEIRRITAPEGAAVTELWDRMCRQVPDGGPLSEAGRRNIQRMLELAAWHHQTFCLVAVEDGEVVGFVVGRADPADGLLPGLVGQVEELYAPEAALRRRLAEAAIATLREHPGMGTIRHIFDIEDREERELFTGLGFEADMVCLSLYGSEEC